ncbi:hypothetical protein BDW71DRAFT_205287 [Aspergillus fruticulosus]
MRGGKQAPVDLSDITAQLEESTGVTHDVMQPNAQRHSSTGKSSMLYDQDRVSTHSVHRWIEWGLAITVGVIGATGTTGGMVVEGLLSSSTDFSVTSLTREVSVNNRANQHLMEKGVKIVAYDLGGPREKLVGQLKEIHVLISCNAWEHLHLQIRWIEAAKEAGMKRFVPSERVGPAPRGVIDIKDKFSCGISLRGALHITGRDDGLADQIRQNSKNEILGAIQRARLPYTIINMGCWYQVWVPRVPSERSDHAHSIYIDLQVVGDGRVRFALAGLSDIGKYVAQIVADPRTLNRHVLAYTEVLSMNEIWDAMAKASGEQCLKDYVMEEELHEIIASCRKSLEASSESMSHPSNIMDTASFNMGQYCISWCARGDNTPEYADYLGYLDYWKLFPNYTKGKRPESNLPRSSRGVLIRNSSHSFP